MQKLIGQVEDPKSHGPYGVVNAGTSVFACKYKDGIMIAADTGVSYGGMRALKDFRRISVLNDETVFSCSGEMADFQNLERTLQKKCEQDEIEQDGCNFLKPQDYFNWISERMYNKRMNMNPDWLTTIVGGINRKNGEPFLGMVDLHGLKVENDYLITGLGAHYCGVLFAN